MSTHRKQKQERLQAPTKAALMDRLNKQVIDLARLIDRERKLGKGPLLNALASWFLDQSLDDQIRITNDGFRLYDQIPGKEVRGSSRNDNEEPENRPSGVKRLTKRPSDDEPLPGVNRVRKKMG